MNIAQLVLSFWRGIVGKLVIEVNKITLRVMPSLVLFLTFTIHVVDIQST